MKAADALKRLRSLHSLQINLELECKQPLPDARRAVKRAAWQYVEAHTHEHLEAPVVEAWLRQALTNGLAVRD